MAGTSLFTGITAQAGTLFDAAMHTLRTSVQLLPTVNVFGDRTGAAPRKSQRYEAIAFAQVAENADLTGEKMDPNVIATLTPAEYGAMALVTDWRVESDPENYILDVGIELGAGARDYVDAQIATNFALLTGGTIGTILGTITWANISSARAIMVANKVPGPYWAALHPFQWDKLVQEAQGNGGAGITNAPQFGDALIRQWFTSTLFTDVSFVISPNVPLNTDGTIGGTAALYARKAIAYDQRRGFRLEPDRDASFRHTEYNATLAFAHGIWDPVRGVQLLGRAETPS